MIEDGYIKLAGAIVGGVANEYISALMSGSEKKCARLENWFLSPYGQLLSMNNGEGIIHDCRKIAQQKRDTMKQKQ